MALRKNDVVSLEITGLSGDGNGVGRVEGMAVFVPFTAVGDKLEVRLVKLCKTHGFGIVETILAPAPSRAAPACALYGKCGGCAFQHLTYKAELAAKQQVVEDALRRLGGVNISVRPILAAPQPQRYRNKAQYPFTKDAEGKVRVGFFAQRSHRVIPCEDCVLQPELLGRIAKTACELLTSYGASVYDEAAHTGLLRHLYLRHAVATNGVMVCFVLNGNALPHGEEMIKALCAQHPEIVTVVLNINRKRTNVILGEKCQTLMGSGVLEDAMGGVPVRLSPLSFYQVNTHGANALYAAAAALAEVQPQETLLDLYCGAGTIGLSMAHQCKRLIGVEIVPQAIENAKSNAAALGISHAEFLCADAAQAAETLLQQGVRPEVVLLDPPRKGCDEATLTAVVQMRPQRIVMISCNPATAARDVKALVSQGYGVQAVQPADLFPRTKHVETIVLLTAGIGLS